MHRKTIAIPKCLSVKLNILLNIQYGEPTGGTRGKQSLLSLYLPPSFLPPLSLPPSPPCHFVNCFCKIPSFWPPVWPHSLPSPPPQGYKDKGILSSYCRCPGILQDPSMLQVLPQSATIQAEVLSPVRVS